jgi:O-acetyl-ADP-ribose deacetylase (regulator of RNase III)
LVGRRWTHPSARLLAAEGDPEDAIVGRARDLVFRATEAGWDGPPFDPFALAELQGIDVLPSQAVVDAAIRADNRGRLRIDYNPDQPTARQRYSVAHELAHGLFPDVAKQARFRVAGKALPGDDWQLELLCNRAAAELLMPVGSIAESVTGEIGIDEVLENRRRYQVSVEAVALRLVSLARSPLLAFAAAPARSASAYRVDYAIPSAAWADAPRPKTIPATSVVAECTAIGYTAKGEEAWGGLPSRIEAVGIPPYPGDRLPRVVGVVRPSDGGDRTAPTIEYLRGDATSPRGEGPRVVVQVVNDKTANWGGGFALVVRRKWPELQDEFREWARSDAHLRLGGVHIAEAEPGLWVASVVALHGYGPSPTPRLRYRALETGLDEVAGFALTLGATVHAPRIGAGQAGGSWAVVSGLIREALCDRGIGVSIYDLPGASVPESATEPQLALDLDRSPSLT